MSPLCTVDLSLTRITVPFHTDAFPISTAELGQRFTSREI